MQNSPIAINSLVSARSCRALLSSAIVGACVTMTNSANAQNESAFALEEVVVTAQRRKCHQWRYIESGKYSLLRGSGA